MIEPPFVPRSIRGTPSAAAWKESLRQGVPRGLVAPLSEWVRRMFSEPDYGMGRMQLSLSKFHAFGLAMNYELGNDTWNAWNELSRGLTETYGEFS